MIAAMAGSDIVVVGGGIAGASLATVMARTGMDVLLLERQAVYRDLVRGELLWPWGVAEARRLGVEWVLLEAGANRATTFESHDEGRSAPYREPVAGLDGAVGSINLAHATACHALAEAAHAAGAAVLRGVGAVSVKPGAQPVVDYVHGGQAYEASPRLVVGADGRTSSVRRDAEIALELDEPAHLVTGLLADGLDGVDESVDLVARRARPALPRLPAARRPRPPLPLLSGRTARPLRRACRRRAVPRCLHARLPARS